MIAGMCDSLRWAVGDASRLWEQHDGKPWMSLHGPLKTFESITRGFAQVCFANNPWSGLFVLVGLIVADPLVALAALLSSIAALCMSRILEQPDPTVVSGLQNYSAVLVGSVTISLFPFFFDGSTTPSVWVGIIFMAALSVCVGIGLNVLLSPVQLPYYTLPFNVTTSLLFLSLRSSGFTSPILIPDFNSTDTMDTIDWSEVFVGVLKSSGQVYAVEDIVASSLILFGLLINSPFLTVMSFIGGLISTLIGLYITTAPYTAVYAGIWGYNGFLAAGCIAFFVNPNFTSIFLALLNAIFAVLIHCGLNPIFKDHDLPVFTFPFCLASLLFLAGIESIPGVERVSRLTFPEEHFWRKREEIKKIRGRKASVPAYVEERKRSITSEPEFIDL